MECPDPPAERHHLIRLPAGGGSLERTRLEFPASWEKYRQFCSFRPPSATKGSKFVNNLNVLPSNSLRIRTGNFLRPYRELNWAIRELSDLIRESRSFNIWEVGERITAARGSRCSTLPSPPGRRIAKQFDYPTPVPSASPDHDAKARGRCRRRSQSRDCPPFPGALHPRGIERRWASTLARLVLAAHAAMRASFKKNFLTLRLPSATRWTNSNLRRFSATCST